MNRIVTVLLASLVLVVGFAPAASAQDKVTMYPYSVFNAKPLAIGTPVWINTGEDDCTYGNWNMARAKEGVAYPMPSTSDACFKNYRKAKIVRIFRGERGTYFYRVQFAPWVDPTDGYRFERDVEFDRLYDIINVPQRWAYSRYFLAMNW